jgi:hypothetical protein
MNEQVEIYAIMRALLEITETNWTVTFKKDVISLNHDKFGSYSFSTIYEVKEFMHTNFIVIGHSLYYSNI